MNLIICIGTNLISVTLCCIDRKQLVLGWRVKRTRRRLPLDKWTHSERFLVEHSTIA
jgi:hypothetical protein